VTSVASEKRRFLALFFPFLPADRLVLAGALREAPFVFVEKQGNAMRLAAVDPQALSLGLTPGLTLADARASVPDLAVFDHDPAADQRLLERLAGGCEYLTPMVALDAPDGLLLDITGCDHLFGGEAGLVHAAEQRLARIGMTVRTALGYAPEAAHALARFQTRPAPDEEMAVRRLTVTALELELEAETGLRRAGLKTIADLADRPSATLAARFGKAMVHRLDCLLGRSDSRIVPRRPVPPLVVEHRFAEPIAHVETALTVLAELAGEAAQVLEQRGVGGRQFQARFFRSDGAVRDIAVETGLPTRDVPVLERLFRERMEVLVDPIDPGFGFDLIRLGVARLERLGTDQLALEGGAVAEAELAGLIDRLSIRLGRNRLRRFAPCDTHIPEQVVLALPAIEAGTPARWNEPIKGEPPLRPLHMFNPPQPIEVMAEVPDGPPRQFRWRRTQHDVARFEGPERIAPEWWRLPPGKPGLTRDYYRIEDVRGRRFWIFRHGLYESERERPDWYLHGLFA
jgi:protein ImuB